ncbi:MAG: hypothetical protein ACLQU2_16330, partial [Candidatus Binataceae bacterium]
GAAELDLDSGSGGIGDVLKPRKRSSVIVSGNSQEQPSPNRWTFSDIFVRKTRSKPAQKSAFGFGADKITDGH